MMNKPADGSSGHFHAVRFYKDSDGLSRIVAEFLAEGLASGQPAIVIATPRHIADIESQLRARGTDVDRLTAERELVLLDADATLAQFMVDGMPDPGRFRRAITPVIEAAYRGRKGCVARAYGEMVDVLWKADQTVAAIRLETLWNALAQSHAFSLLCGYSLGNFYKAAAVEDICGQHSHVISEAGQAALVQ